MTALGRIGKVEDIADAVALLASPGLGLGDRPVHRGQRRHRAGRAGIGLRR